MQLVPKSQHPSIPGGIFWETLHPDGKGEFQYGENKVKLTDLVEYFRCSGDFKEFCAKQALDSESEVIEIYGISPFHLDMELAFFPIEETEGSLQYTYDGRDYYNLFDF